MWIMQDDYLRKDWNNCVKMMVKEKNLLKHPFKKFWIPEKATDSKSQIFICGVFFGEHQQETDPLQGIDSL